MMQDSHSSEIEQQIANLDKAIAAMETQRPVLGDEVVDSSVAALQKERRELQAKLVPDRQQRKLATILFVDIAGHTQIISDIDPEDNMEIIDSALVRLAPAVERHGGRVARYQGDGFKAFFGYPVARENDPEMAVRAGMEILARSQELADVLRSQRNIESFQVRVGIDTGLVFIGGETEGLNTVKGTAVNLAARLESAAPPGGLLISQNTYRHVRGLFDFEALEPMLAKGFSEPVPVYLVKGLTEAGFKRSSRGVEGVDTEMVGRQQEFDSLESIFKNTLSRRRSYLATVIGEAGLGKSRLLFEFEKWVKAQYRSVRIFEGRSLPETQKTPYALLHSLLSLQFDIRDSDPPEEARRKFEAGFVQAAGAGEEPVIRSHFVGQMLGFDFGRSPHLSGILDDNQQLHDRAQAYLADWFKRAAEQTPILVLLEDIHWADDNTLALLLFLLESLSNYPVLFVCNSRPVLLAREKLWGDGPSQTRIRIEPLSRQDSRQLVAEIFKKADQVPLVLREMIVSGAEGNPFYIEELIKMLIEKGMVQKNGDEWHIEPAGLESLEIPPTLTGILQARLDGLPPLERMILQQASVIGRIFWDDILFQINSSPAGGDQHEIRAALASLQQKEMVFRRKKSAIAEAEEYKFKHAILRDVTYETVLKRTRPIYHSLVAEWLVSRRGERLGEFTGLIGDHFERAGETEKAVQYLQQAGETAFSQYANDEAVHFLTRALTLLPKDKDRERFDLLMAREKVHSLMGVRQAQQDDLNVLSGLAAVLDDPNRQARVALRRSEYASQHSDYEGIIRHAGDAVELGEAIEQPGIVGKGCLFLGRALLAQGDYAAARQNFRRALVIGNETGASLIEADALLNLGIVAERLDAPGQAEESYKRALEIYRRMDDRRGEGRALNKLGNVRMLQGDVEEGQAYYDEYLEISRQIGDRWGEGIVIREQGDAHLFQLNLTVARQKYAQALAISDEIKNRTMQLDAKIGLGVISLEHADFDEAQTYFESSLLVARSIGNRPREAKILSHIGRFFHRLGDYVRARRYYDQSLSLLEELGSRSSLSWILAFQSLLALHLGSDAEALELAEAARRIAEERSLRSDHALALTHLGHALSAGGDQETAGVKYEEARRLYEEMGQANLAVEPLAGQARTALDRGTLDQALGFCEIILTHLGKFGGSQEAGAAAVPGLEGATDPLQVLFTCYQVLEAAGDERAGRTLAWASALLQAQADKILDVDMRHAFLNNVAVNRIVQRTFESLERKP